MLDYRKHAAEHLDKFKGIKLLVVDNDGIMTAGDCGVLSQDYPIFTEFSVLDGFGLIHLKEAGIKFAVVSGRANEALQRRLEIVGHPNDLHMGVKHKGTYVKELIEKYGLTKEQVAFMGDDYIDISAFKEVGLAITVPNRHPIVDPYVNYTTLNHGGRGALREVLDLLRIANEDDSEFTAELKKFFRGEQ